MFDRSVYIERRHKLVQASGSGLLLFFGNDESPMNYKDNPFRYRQDSTFLYYFGLSFSGLAALIDIDAGTEMLFGNDLTVDDMVWMGSQPSLAEKAESVGVSQIFPASKLKELITAAIQNNRTVHYLPPYRDEHIAKLHQLTGMPVSAVSEAFSVPFVKAVVNQRNIKTVEEIAEMDRAAAVSADMHMAAYQMARPGMTEAEIAAEVHKIALAAGGDIAFPIIATINGQTLHNHYHGNTLKSGDLFLLDAGAETGMGYAGDLSSTMPVDPVFTERQKEIYQIALNAHEKGVSMLKPGVPFRDVHLACCREIASGMKNIGLMKGDIDEAVQAGAHALFFPCGTGHMMGLDVHDMENLGEVWVGYDGEPKSTQFGLKSLRLARPLKPGFVLTVEPGIYFIPELIDLWKSEKRFDTFLDYNKIEQYRDFGGLRNEEDFVITQEGARCLGKKKPKTIEEVEAARQAALS